MNKDLTGIDTICDVTNLIKLLAEDSMESLFSPYGPGRTGSLLGVKARELYYTNRAVNQDMGDGTASSQVRQAVSFHIVTKETCETLLEMGEEVCADFAGVCVWARMF